MAKLPETEVLWKMLNDDFSCLCIESYTIHNHPLSAYPTHAPFTAPPNYILKEAISRDW